MAKPILDEELWTVLEPLLPPESPRPRGGRPRVPNRQALTGILFVLRSGIPWEMLPRALGCGSGMSCWRRLKGWHQARLWPRIHRELLNRLGKTNQIDWSRASLDSGSVPAKKGVKPPARIRRIAATRARSALLWSSDKASRSR
jgi:transposase